jgi:hypothetical protein
MAEIEGFEEGSYVLVGEMIVVTRRIRAWIMIVGCAGLAFFPSSTASVLAGNDRPSVALAAFSYKDTSGEVRDQTAEHHAKLEMFTRVLRENVENGGKFAIVEIQCQRADCAVEDGVAPPALAESAAKAGARYLVVGGVQKLSTLVQWARVGVLDLKNRKAVLDRLYTFRGDTEDAWRHAALFVARHVNEMPLED